MKNITIFTLPTCPKCRVIKAKLTSAGAEFEECQDVERMQKLGIESTPALLIGPENRLIKSFVEINEYVTVLCNKSAERK